MFDEEAEEYKDNTRIKDKNTYVGFPNERISELQDFEGNYIDISERIIKAFKDGADFGYNKCKEEMQKNGLALQSDMDETIEQNIALKKELEKANEWYYVKDKLPKKSDSTLCELIPVFVAVKVGYRVSTYGTYWNLKLGKFECLDEVYAWCYTPEPPELPKESE